LLNDHEIIDENFLSKLNKIEKKEPASNGIPRKETNGSSNALNKSKSNQNIKKLTNDTSNSNLSMLNKRNVNSQSNEKPKLSQLIKLHKLK
jgi:hypothetical protein